MPRRKRKQTGPAEGARAGPAAGAKAGRRARKARKKTPPARPLQSAHEISSELGMKHAIVGDGAVLSEYVSQRYLLRSRSHYIPFTEL